MTMTEMDRFLKVAYDDELAEKVYPLIQKIKEERWNTSIACP